MADWLSKPKSLRGRLRDIPALNHSGLRDCQIIAIENLEKSFRDTREDLFLKDAYSLPLKALVLEHFFLAWLVRLAETYMPIAYLVL
jgi:hypothetical protein